MAGRKMKPYKCDICKTESDKPLDRRTDQKYFQREFSLRLIRSITPNVQEVCLTCFRALQEYLLKAAWPAAMETRNKEMAKKIKEMSNEKKEEVKCS